MFPIRARSTHRVYYFVLTDARIFDERAYPPRDIECALDIPFAYFTARLNLFLINVQMRCAGRCFLLIGDATRGR